MRSKTIAGIIGRLTAFTLVTAGLLVICFISQAGATTVLSDSGFIANAETRTYEMVFDSSSTSDSTIECLATLADLSADSLGFDFLALFITTADHLLGYVVGSGSVAFDATPGVTYYANLIGITSAPLYYGLFGVKVDTVDADAVPIPGSLLLLGSSLVSLGFYRGRNRMPL